MSSNRNPFLIYEEPYEEHYDQQVKQKAEVVKELEEFQRLCFSVFHSNPEGKKLYELLKEKYINCGKFSPTSHTAAQEAMYWEGFREAIRGIYNQGLIHHARVNTQGSR